MTRVTCRLTAQNRDQVRNPPLGNRVWANFTILIHNSSLNTSTHSARKVGFIFDEHLTFSDQSYLQKSASYLMNTSPSLTSRLSKSCYYHIVSFAVSIHTSTQKKHLPPSSLPLFTLSSTTAPLFVTTCQSLRSPGSNRPRTHLHVLLSKLPNPVTSLPSFGLCTG